MASHKSQVPAAALRYFTARGVDDHPVIAQVFTPGKGWKGYGVRKRVSASAVRKLRAEGVTNVALSAGGHRADFSADELCL